MSDTTLLHIAQRSDLVAANANGHYRAASLDSEGFLHCCHPTQLSGVVQRWFDGVDDLVLLTINSDTLPAPLVHENTTGGEELFPHVYGEIPLSSIIAQHDFGLNSVRRQQVTGDKP